MSRFVLTLPAPEPGQEPPPAAVIEPLDRAMLRRLGDVVARCTEAFDAFDHARALEATEEFFWFFCDDYVELVKARGYGEQGSQAAWSAISALRFALSAVLRLFAPFLPFVAEEAWSWWQEGSIHRAPWPDPGELRTAAVGADPGRGHAVTAGAEAARVLDAASAAIAAVRGAKSAARLSMRAPVRKLVVSAGEDDITAVRAVLRDVQAAGQVEQIVVRPSASARPVHQVTL